MHNVHRIRIYAKDGIGNKNLETLVKILYDIIDYILLINYYITH